MLQKISVQISRRTSSKHTKYTYYVVNKLKTMGSLPDKKRYREQTVLTGETLDGIGARLETLPRKSLK
jgi:hypothetical protein